MVYKVKVIKELFNPKFQQELRKMAEDKANELMNENPEEVLLGVELIDLGIGLGVCETGC